MATKEEIIKLLKDNPEVLNLVKTVYEWTGTSCQRCIVGDQAILKAMVPFESVLEKQCSSCNGEGSIKLSFDEVVRWSYT